MISVATQLNASNPISESLMGAGRTQAETGVALLRAGKYDQAIVVFTALLAETPSLVDARLLRAEAYRLKGDYMQALADLDAANELAPGNARILFNRGMVHGLLRRLGEAIADYTASLQADPNQPLAWTNRGSAHLSKGLFDEALADLSRAVELDPSSPLPYQTRGDVFVFQGQYDQAIEDYTLALRRTPCCAPTYIRRGNAYKFKREYERAISDYSHALRLDPLHVAGYLCRASAYRRTSQYDLALADLNAAIRLEPDSLRIYHKRAVVFRALKDYRSALADFDRALAHKEDAELLHERGCTHELQGSLEQALADYNAALGVGPQTAELYRTRGTLLVRMGQIDEGIGDFTQAILLPGDLCQAYLDRARAWLKKGRLDHAIGDCTLALEQNAKAKAAYLIRGDAHVQQGDFQAASDDFTAALQLDPRDAHAHQARGQAALHQGEYAKAFMSLSRSLELNPANAEALSLRASVHQALGQHDEALADLTQAVLLDAQYTAAYCNQRAQLHLLDGEYEQALADFAIVLQLDPANVPALIGREQALEALKAPARQRERLPSKNGAAKGSRAGGPSSRRSGEKTADGSRHTAPPTQVHQLGKQTQPQIAIEAEFIPEDGTQPRADTAAPPTLEGEVRPDQAVEPPATETIPLQASPEQAGDDDYLRLDPADSRPPAGGPHRAVGPVEQELARTRERMEIEERARKWEDMRARERQKSLGYEPSANTSRTVVESSEGSSVPWGMLLKVAGVLLVLGALGAGGYFLFFHNREPRLDAIAVWKEYDMDTAAANLKYKGKFVQVTGKVKEFTSGQAKRFFFQMPGDAKWGVEFNVRVQQAKELKEGQTVTIRGRFNPRKGTETNVVMSNCNLISAGP
jgi:tetratricopeptide (TPR) repeat protein